MELEKFKEAFPEDELQEALKEALELKNKVLVELVLAVGVDTYRLEDELIWYAISTEDTNKLKETIKSYNPSQNELQRYMRLAIEIDNKEIVDILYRAGCSREFAMREALNQGNTRLARILVEEGVVPEITGGTLEMYLSFVQWVVTNEYPADFSETAIREYCIIIGEYNQIDVISHLKNQYPAILQQLIEISIKHGYTKVVKYLVEEDLIKDEVIHSLFTTIIANNYYYIIKYLVEGGKYKVTNKDVLYAVHFSTRLVKFLFENCQEEKDERIYSLAVMEAVDNENTETAKFLLKAGFKCDFSKAISKSAGRGNKELVGILLEHANVILDKAKFQEAIAIARDNKFYKTAIYMENYLEENPDKFANE